MKARDIMTTRVITVGPCHSVRHAAAIMLENRLSGLPVIDDGKLVGMITEGDLLRREELGTEAVAEGTSGIDHAAAYISSHSWRVKDVMSHDVVSIDGEASLRKICSLMILHGINRVPVVNEGRIVGIVSRFDLLRVIAMKNSPNGPSDDRSLERAVRTRLETDLALDVSAVQVSVTNGCVSLKGKVATESMREAARVAAENVRGVIGVATELVVRPVAGSPT